MAKILLLGAYGLIGTGVAQALAAAGHEIVAFGRSARAAGKLGASYDWVIGDMRDHLDADSWQPLLEGVDVVVNAAGALQDGPDDDLEAVHHFAIKALARACAGSGASLIQISASGATLEANTEFMRSKARGDAAIGASGCKHFILRPGLVLAEAAYGGTLLLRQLAAVPWVQPVALGKTQVQTVSLPDVARAVLECVEGRVPEGAYDLVEKTPHKLRDVLRHMRSWLGFQPARLTIPLPKLLLWPVAKMADGLGWLGWRSPLRSTAVATLKGGVLGDAAAWNATGAAPMGDMAATLATLSARAEDRLAARMALLMPLVVAVLAVFWLASGLVGLWKMSDAAEVLTQVGWAQPMALASVGVFAVLDIALGLLVLVRKHAAKALWGMIGVSLFYLLSASVVTPALWLDPLGPLVKVLPSVALALVALPMLETR